MHIIRDKKTIITMKLASCIVPVTNIVLSGLVLLEYRKGLLTRAALILVAMLLMSAIIGFFFYRHYYILDYSADPTGIKILSGKRVKKDMPWHSFNYVGELNIAGKYGPQKVIACLPQPPKPALSKEGDCYTFSQKGVVWIDYNPEDAQNLRAYYRGQLPQVPGT